MDGLNLGVINVIFPYLSYMFGIFEKIINQMFAMFGVNLDEIEVPTDAQPTETE